MSTIEEFHNFFSTSMFFLACENFCLVSLGFGIHYLKQLRHAIYFGGRNSLNISCCLLGAVAASAAEVPLVTRRIRTILLDIMSFAQRNCGFTGTNRQIVLLLNREPSVLSACNAFPLDRVFLLKFTAANVAQALVFYQIPQYRS